LGTTLVTGGAGFIGGHVARGLLADGEHVRVLDCFAPQVHGGTRPEYLEPDAEVVDADVRDPSAVRRALEGVDRVVHLAARVGVGQSMYEIDDYVDVNTRGTAVLLEALAEHPVERLVVASSMSIYGEGCYVDDEGTAHKPQGRTRAQLEAGDWEPHGPQGQPLRPVPTPEASCPSLASVYALSKYDQERLCLLFGDAYRIPTVALRLFNVYGPDQALSNPYTGVLAIFAARFLNGRPPVVYEDGGQRRDFVSVHDVVRAFQAALVSETAVGQAFNVASGSHHTVLEIANLLGAVLGVRGCEPELTATYRAGDVRHCFADVGRAREVLGYEPQVGLDRGLAELVTWLDGRTPVDSFDDAAAELAVRGLAV
jgi:dTDP-L-rhamnose 4-epimerase